jgi:quercetin dioxygenase-like cupin family protein
MNRNGQPFAFDREIEWEPAGEGVRRKVLTYNAEVMMVRVVFEAGAIGTPH